ncbi:Long-chain-fatty-acid--CoA ligase [Rhodovulum sp. PH10]|uniref:malonate--CoA ligase n=1 Tax=Rhodovulum sp. PH10 TaxID=1187851 RepID=UPI00027C2ECA|nr:malonyl-CoA synthase [Rhodovulum sp. PH10]EJW09823.1 Long-chain-fatty-acid--CoA ligase [Rhodovulum sp. PH10]
MSGNLFSLVRARIPSPGKTLIETPAGERITYGDMLARTARLANALVRLGVVPGDRVAVQVEKSPDNLMLFLAVARAGAVYLPLNTAYTVPELDYFIGDAEPRLVVCDPAKRENLAPVAAAHGATLETLDAKGGGSLMALAAQATTSFTDVVREPTDLAAILYTSGTTGRSKGAMLTHRNLVSNADTLVKYWRFTKDDVLLHALPIYHTHGLFTAALVLMLAGGSMLWMQKFDADQVVAALPRVTTMMGVPTFYVRLLTHPKFDKKLTAHMRLFTSGSAPLLAETHEAFRERTGHAILERYGMTETGMNTSNPYDGDRVPGTVGFPLPEIEVRVADAETGQPVPQGEIGVLEVKGPNVFAGYWRMPEKTAAEFRPDGFFITGDVGKIDLAGYVHIVGRAKDLIITGGFNVYPKEVESEIDVLPGVVESAVIGCPHADFGEGVTAVVVKAPDATVTESEILSALDGRLAKFKLPKRVLFVDELPRNTMGKVQKNVLREQNKDLYAS